MHINIADDASLIDDEDCPLRFAIGAQYTIFFGDFAVRPEIAEKGKTDASKAFCPGLQAGDMVNADAQNLGIQSRELGFFGLVRRDLAASYGGESQGKERQDHVLATKLVKRDCRIQVGFEGKVGCGIANFQFHDDLHTHDRLL
jgi:hypothetical protein